MTPSIQDAMVAASASLPASILLKVTATTILGLIGARVARRASAAVRHLILAAAFAVLLVLPFASIVAPAIRVSVPVAPQPPIAVTAPIEDSTTITSAPAPTGAGGVAVAEPSRDSAVSFPTVLLGAWLFGAALFVAPVLIGLWQVRALRRAGLPWPEGQSLAASLARDAGIRRGVDVLLHESLPGPMTCGLTRAVVLLPKDARQWAPKDVQAALVHELEHVRRADWAGQCLARLLCAGYWFHPLIWITWRQFALEAERACDDAVLRRADATAYADQLVALAERLSGAARSPVLAMANRHDLAARVRALLDGRRPRGRAGAWLVAGVSCVAAVLIVVLSPMRVVAESQRPQVAADRPHFDVVSVKPCDPATTPPPPPAGGGRSGNPGQSPVHFRLDCRSVNVLINYAYVTFADGRYNRPSAQPIFDMVSAGPDWSRSEKFTIEATTADATPVPVMQGPMLQAVLEDRFKLKMHRETRDVPVLELVVAKGGSKLTPFKPGTCVPWDFSVFPQPPLEPGQRRCMGGTEKDSDGNYVETVEAMTLDEWAAGIDNHAVLGKPPIVNRTGITGLQTFRFVYSSTSEDLARDIKNSLGLELRPARGPREFLILDHVERPEPDGPSAIGAPQVPADTQKFEVASIKPCPGLPPPGSGRGIAPWAAQVSPGYVHWNCVTLLELINQAYAGPSNPLLNSRPFPRPDDPKIVRGGPSWVDSELYTIEARGAVALEPGMVNGPMMRLPVATTAMIRTLLEDRFQLKLRRVTEERSMYALTVAKDGLKIKRTSPDECWVKPPDALPRAPAPPGFEGKPTCGSANAQWGRTVTWKFTGADMKRVAASLSSDMDMMVFDKTGLGGTYTFGFEYLPDDRTPGLRLDKDHMRTVAASMGVTPTPVEPREPLPPATGPSIFKALEALGLKLEPAKGPAEYFVIDRVERPKPNAPVSHEGMTK